MTWILPATGGLARASAPAVNRDVARIPSYRRRTGSHRSVGVWKTAAILGFLPGSGEAILAETYVGSRSCSRFTEITSGFSRAMAAAVWNRERYFRQPLRLTV